jgi:hypothetical protein
MPRHGTGLGRRCRYRAWRGERVGARAYWHWFWLQCSPGAHRVTSTPSLGRIQAAGSIVRTITSLAAHIPEPCSRREFGAATQSLRELVMGIGFRVEWRGSLRHGPPSSSWRKPGPISTMGTGRSLSSGRAPRGPGGRCDRIRQRHWSCCVVAPLQSGLGPTTSQRWRSKSFLCSSSLAGRPSESASMRPPAAAGV